jgi:hypothetical protein
LKEVDVELFDHLFEFVDTSQFQKQKTKQSSVQIDESKSKNKRNQNIKREGLKLFGF